MTKITCFILREAIAYANDRGSTVYVAFLDIKKAFDNVAVRFDVQTKEEMN